MTWFIAALRIIGLVTWADALAARIEAKHEQQRQANVPLTKQEELDDFDRLPRR